MGSPNSAIHSSRLRLLVSISEPFLIALVNDVVQIVGLLLGQGLEPKVVNDQKIIAAVVLDAAIAGEIGPGRFQSTDRRGAWM